VPVRKVAQNPLQDASIRSTLPLFLRDTLMKIIYTRQNKDGSYDEVGMNNQRLTSNYTTTNGFIRYGIPSDFYGNTLRLQVFYGDNIYRAPDKVMFVTV
jgi:hypothetical protein